MFFRIVHDFEVLKPKGFVTSDILTSSGKDISDLMEAI